MSEEKQPPSDRTLQRDIPELMDYLRPGMRVLDVGCGTGTITVGVAEVVKPGTVVGIDPAEDQLKKAAEYLGEVPHPRNVSFQQSDSHELPFADGSFDVVYSHTALHFFLDPVAALKEQNRVTKRGGWVIASGVRLWVPSVRHPACPNWDKLRDAHRLYDERLLGEYTLSGWRPAEYLQEYMRSHPRYWVYMDVSAGSKCTGWMHDAGFTHLRVAIKPEILQYSGSEYMERNPRNYDRVPVREPTTDREKELWATVQEEIAMGLIDSATVERARQERDRWYEDPQAFNFFILVLVAGRA